MLSRPMCMDNGRLKISGYFGISFGGVFVRLANGLRETRQVRLEFTAKSSIQQILKEQKFYVELHQAHNNDAYNRRLAYCNWLLDKVQ